MKRPLHLLGCPLLMAAAGACDAPDTRNCPLVASNGSDRYLLDYELLIPSNCPVPLGSVGEWKRAGAGGNSADPYGQIRITYTGSAMANVIEGNAIPPRHTTATWRAAATGGAPPYNYYWYRDGALVGTSEYYTGATGAENFGLRAVVVDQTMTERTAVFPVDVGGALVHVDGPEMAYLYTYDPFISNATWTAVVTGGTAPFSYRWYRDGYPTGGDTSSHTEHIDQRGDFTLRVVVLDATGKMAVSDRFVRVGEISCSTCYAH